MNCLTRIGMANFHHEPSDQPLIRKQQLLSPNRLLNPFISTKRFEHFHSRKATLETKIGSSEKVPKEIKNRQEKKNSEGSKCTKVCFF